jgi:hypothetical protein
MSNRLIFACEGENHEIQLFEDQSSATLRQLKAWLPAEISIHCAKIAGCHIYWPSPILAPLESARDIHSLEPGAFLYYPDRQYLEIIYDQLQAETAAVNHLGQLQGDIGWLRDFATRQRQRAGYEQFKARLYFAANSEAQPLPVYPGDSPWDRIRTARLAVWESVPDEVEQLISNTGLNIPFGPMVTADGYFRSVQESLWQLWNQPDRFSDAQRRAAAVNVLELGIARIGHYCQMHASEAVLTDVIQCVEEATVPFQEVLAETVLYCSRMSNWIDHRIPWFDLNELTKSALQRNQH